MRVAILSLHYNPITGAGLHQVLRMFLDFVSSAGHQTTLFTILSDNNILPKDKRYAVIEKNLGGSFLKTQKNVAELLLAEENNFDIYFICGPALLWAGGMYRKHGGKNPTVVFVNNYTSAMWRISLKGREGSILFHIKKYLWEKMVGLSLAKYLDAFIYDSPIIGKLYEQFGYPKLKSKLLFEPMELQNNALNRDEGKANDRFKALFVGRLVKEKGVDILLKAMLLLKNDKTIQLDIVGDGPEKKWIQKFIEKNNLSETVKLHPWQARETLATFYKNADVFVHPCRWIEPFGRTIVEAMDFGLPIITTSNTGASWAMGRGGLSFKNGNEKELAEKIKILQKNTELKISLSKEAKLRAREFDYKKTLPVLMDFIEKLAKG